MNILYLNRFLPLWVGARGIEFDWKYIQMSFDSNIALVSSISLTKKTKQTLIFFI
jgi:hypothetical protein